MVPPALRLHNQQIEDGHNGDRVDKKSLVLTDHGEVEITSRRDEDIDLDATRLVSSPARKAAIQYAMRCLASFGLHEVIAIILSYDCFFYILWVKFVQIVIF